MNRWLSGARSALNGVTTGASTPLMGSLMISTFLILTSYFLISRAPALLIRKSFYYSLS
jgi:hypothetical protein